MSVNMEIDNLNLYLQNFNYGRLIGQLETLARFNDKTNNGHRFELNRYSKKENIKASVKVSFENHCSDYNLIEVTNPQEYLLQTLLDSWFFNYQNSKDLHLTDTGNNFSLFKFHNKEEFVKEFVDLLYATLKPRSVYKIEMIQQTSYYASFWEDIVFETHQNQMWNYMLHLELHD